MSSGAQAQIAASQAATEAQAEAARNALAFSKEQFEYMKGLRRPYTDAGASATQMLMNLLGLNQNVVQGGGAGGGGVYNPGGGFLGNIEPANPGGSGGTGGGSGGSGTSGGTQTNTNPVGTKFPGYVPPPYTVGDAGKEKPVPGDQPILPNPIDVESGGDPGSYQPWYPGQSKTSGLVDITDPTTGTKRSVPNSLVSFYAAKGWKV